MKNKPTLLKNKIQNEDFDLPKNISNQSYNMPKTKPIKKPRGRNG